jgi:nicotinate-nucleotide adenylyltransferase
MMALRRLGLLGGTLDPVHYGHLDAADAARVALSLDEVWLLPSHDPPHRPTDPVASGFHRFALAALAIADRPTYRVSDIELRRPGLTYTVDTLHALHADGWTPSQLFFIIGTDAFAEIATWREFPTVLDAAHFAVIARPGLAVDEALARTPGLQGRACLAAQFDANAGGTRIILINAQTRDVSSTAIRSRLRQRQRIDDLVPAVVARHIVAHQLYGAVDDLHGESKDSLGR